MNNKTISGMKCMFYLLGSLVVALPAQAASFDCAKAATKVEKLICGDAALSKLDEELNAAYKAALQDVKNADTVKQAQKQWIKERNGCANADCVKQSYGTRLATLSSFDGVSAKLNSVGQYKMIGDTIDVPQPNGISKLEKHAEVCTAFLKNLEAFPSFPPMACDVKFKPEFEDFKTPEWQDIDVWENRDLWLQIDRMPPKDEAEKERMLADLKDRIKSGMVFFRTSRFDIDNDGVLDQVLKISTDKCDPANRETNDVYHHNRPSYTIYDPVTRKVDVAKTAFYFWHWNENSLFSFKGVAYFASLFRDTTNEPYFGKLERPSIYGYLPVKYYIKLFRPLPMEQGLRTASKHTVALVASSRSVALGCTYLYLPPKNEGGY